MKRAITPGRVLLAMLLWGLCATAFAQYSCTASTTGTINFMVYNPAAATPATASATAGLSCTYVSGGPQSIAWSMQLSNGSSGNCAGRKLPGAGSTLDYNVYQNSVGGGVWGNAACASYPAGTLKVSSGQRTQGVTNTLFGRIPAGQFVPVGAYGESLTLTFSY